MGELERDDAGAPLVGATAADVLAFFDRQAPVSPEELIGRWRGEELPSGHPFDGLLAAYGWYGKEWLGPDRVHPLLFAPRGGRPHPVNPTPAPLGLLRRGTGLLRTPPARAAFVALEPLLRTRRPHARTRVLQHRGVATSALVYDRLPVIDVLRRVSADTVVGLMDMRGVAQPYSFLLHRDGVRGH